MDSELELDSVGDASPPPELDSAGANSTTTSNSTTTTSSASNPAPPRQRKPVIKRQANKRDPNEAIAENWQRRPHLADRMDPPRLKKTENVEFSSSETGVIAENYGLRINAYVFVYETTSNFANEYDAWDTPLPAFKIGRIVAVRQSEEVCNVRFRINWVLRANEVYVRSGWRSKPLNTREVYISQQFAEIPITSIRGECVVQHEHEIRTLTKFREKASQFYFSKYYDHATRKLHDIVPLSALKSLVSANKLANLGLTADYAIVSADLRLSLQELPKTKRGSASVALEISDEEAELPNSSVNLDECLQTKNNWPFGFFDEENNAWGALKTPKKRIGADFQCAVDEWLGAPLKYYTTGRAKPRSSSRGLKWVEPAENSSSAPSKSDLTQKWVQKMPSGYIPRGGDATSLLISRPSSGLADFVALCQKTYALPLEILPTNLNFLDACCTTYTQCRDADQALPLVARLSKRSLVPDLSVEDLHKFLRLMNPFQSPDWSRVYREMGNKPFLELCLFYWSQLPAKLQFRHQISDSKQLKDHTETEGLRCIECHTDQAPEWVPLPAPVFCLAEETSREAGSLANTPQRQALCARCARLWFRYRTGWKKCSEMDLDAARDELIEPELLDDANAYLTEQERRSKRRQAAAEKREATTKRKVIEKEAKQAAKRLKKEIKANGGASPDVPNCLLDPKSSDPKNLEPKSSEPKSSEPKNSKSKSSEPKNLEPKNSEASASKRESQSRSKSKPSKLEPDPKHTEDGSTTEDSDANPSRVRGTKRRNVLDTQLSLDLVDEILASLDEEIEPENQSVPKTCPVCGQNDPSLPQLTCASCLVTVHAACYGASLVINDHETWFCDCCRNSRGKLDQMLDLNYQCELCPPRSPEYASWQAGVPGNHAPDLLKPTLLKRWCHIRCAVFNPQVSFADPQQLTGIDTQSSLSAPVSESQACCLCKTGADLVSDSAGLTPVPTIYLADGDQLRSIPVSQSSAILPSRMGATVKCELCSDYFHVSCAADHQFFLGLTANNTRATIVCSQHLHANSQPQTYKQTPFSQLQTNLNMTALQLFVSKCKQSPVRSMSSKLRIREYQTREHWRLNYKTSAAKALILNESQSLSVQRCAPKCAQCHTANSSFWHSIGANENLCSWCFRGYTIVSQLPESRSFWTTFFSKAGRFPNTDRQKPPRVSL